MILSFSKNIYGQKTIVMDCATAIVMCWLLLLQLKGYARSCAATDSINRYDRRRRSAVRQTIDGTVVFHLVHKKKKTTHQMMSSRNDFLLRIVWYKLPWIPNNLRKSCYPVLDILSGTDFLLFHNHVLQLDIV